MTSNESVALFHSIITASIINSNVRRESTKISKNQYYAQSMTIIFCIYYAIIEWGFVFQSAKDQQNQYSKDIGTQSEYVVLTIEHK